VASPTSNSQETLKNPFEDNNQSSSISLTTSPTTHSSESSTRRGSSNSTKFLDYRDKYVSELLYIHDKLMIVDDRIVIMGSGKVILICLILKFDINDICY
jgi:phosphatidylserine/phosphatidylglycerophosphate/cardiolipin synthase-like enzyme